MFFFFTNPATAGIYTYCPTLSLHDPLPISAFERNLEGAQVAFAVRSLVDLGGPAVAVGLVRIEREMLDRRHDARRLRPQNRLCPHDARQKRVFRNIFEVTAVPRIAD